METVQFQSYVFSYTVYGGILIGVLYDIYRVLKGGKKNERLVTSFWDVLFLASVFVVIMWAVFSSSYGDVRAYVLIGFIVGFYLYEKLLGRIVAGVFHFLCRSVSGFFKRTNSIAALPVKLFLSFIYSSYTGFVRLLGRKRTRLKKIRKLPKQVLDDSKKYYKLIVRRKIKGGK